MLELVYVEQGGKRNFVPLGDKDLMRLTRRSRSQISYDRRALDGLVKLGMLRKVAGRGSVPNGYSLREPRLWDSRIRWLGPRERIISFFWALQPRDLFDLSRDGAGHSIFFRATGNHWDEIYPREAPGQAFSHRAAREFHRAENLAIHAHSEGGDRAANSAQRGAVHTVLIDPSYEGSNSSSSSEEEEELRKATNKVAAAIGQQIGRPLVYGPFDKVATVVRRFPDRVDELLALVPTIGPIKSPPGAVDAFERAAQLAAERGWARQVTHQVGSAPAGFDGPLSEEERAWVDDPAERARILAEARARRPGNPSAGQAQAVGFGA